MKTKLDHIVIGAADLESGVRYIEQKLGVTMPKGGAHPLMATHNHLMRIGDQVFIEIIAIDPAAAPPLRPRWYGLDDPSIRQLLNQGPRLLTWVVNSSNISALVAASDFAVGTPLAVSRGDLHWHFAVPDDGRLLAGGLVPYVMQWHSTPHPSGQMSDLGCGFRSITLFHPYPHWLETVLHDIGASGIACVEATDSHHAPYMQVTLDTPAGEAVLDSRG